MRLPRLNRNRTIYGLTVCAVLAGIVSSGFDASGERPAAGHTQARAEARAATAPEAAPAPAPEAAPAPAPEAAPASAPAPEVAPRAGSDSRALADPVPAPTTTTDRAAVFGGTGAWIDRYDQPLWDNPIPVLDTMRARGVRTLYIQTSMSAERYTIKEPAKLDVILREAHARDILVVGWYLPYARRRAGRITVGSRRVRYVNKTQDLRRSKRAISYVSADGEHRFDGFGLDIEPATGTDHGVESRQSMLVEFSRQLRRHAGPDYPLAAIVPPPVHNTDNPRTSWKRFPWAGLTPYYDAWMPMLFFRQWQLKGVRVDRGFERDVDHIRKATKADASQLPVHIIGEVAADAGPRELRQFETATRRSGASGASIYDAYSSDRHDWASVQRLSRWFARTP
jgi:hypothetical protein